MIVLYLGRMTVQRRRDLARLCWERRRTFIVIDEALILYLCGERDSRLVQHPLRCLVRLQPGECQPQVKGGGHALHRTGEHDAGVIGALQVFDIVFVMTGQTAETNSTNVLNLYIYRQFTYGQYGYAAAIGVVIFALTLSATLAQLWWFRKREAAA